jgi:transcriptional regulator with XRE-family HTH domain
MDLPTAIKKARHAKGLTQRDLAVCLHVSPAAVAQWELGQTAPTPKNRADLARVLGAAVAGEFVDDRDELTVLHLWRRVVPQERNTVLKILAALAGKEVA